MGLEYKKGRKLDNKPLTGSGSIFLPLSTDFEAIEYSDHALTGAIQTTYASGTPASRQEGPLHQLIPVIRVLRESDAFKQVSPHLMNIQNTVARSQLPIRRASANTGADVETTVDVIAFPFGTTTQFTTVEDSCRIHYGLPLVRDEDVRRLSWFRTMGLSSAAFEYQQNAFNKLQSAANTAPVTYANSTLQIETSVSEVKNVDAAKPTGVVLFKETMTSDSINSQVTDRRIKLQQGNALAAVHVWATDGATGSSTTATDQVSNNKIITNMKLVANSDRYLYSGTFKQCQRENKTDYGFNAPMTSNRSIVDGYALMNFVEKDLSQLIDTRRGVVESLDLIYDTASSSVITYTNGVNIVVKVDEIVNLPRR